MEWYLFLIIAHVFGAVLGVGGATFAEIFLLKSLRDGEIDPLETSFLRITYTVIRVGLFILILSGFGFLLYYRLVGDMEAILDPQLWAKLTILLFILLNAILLQTRKIRLAWGSAISLASWYAALIIGAWDYFENVGFFEAYFEVLLWYAGFVLLVGVVLYIIRKLLGVNL